MIELNEIYVKTIEDKVLFCSRIKIDHKEQEIWFSAEKRFEKYISLSNGDCFALVLFIYAVFNKKKFISHVPVSKRLKYGIVNVLLNTFIKFGVYPKELEIKLDYEDKTLFPEANSIGTAMSLGVDSFFTLSENMNSSYAVNILTLFNAGAYGQYGGGLTRQLFDRMKQHVDDLSKESGLDFLWVDTNLNETLRMPFLQTHIFRNFSCVLMFQKLFKSYYYASGVTLNDFKFDINGPASYYELFSSKAIAGNSLEFNISGLNEGRLHKTKILTDYELTYTNLNVCLVTSDNDELSKENGQLKNCSKCYKCIRTMVSLDVLNKLNLYRNVFDLDTYKRNKEKYLAEILYMKIRANDIYSLEIFEYVKIKKYKISLKVYCYLILRFLQPITRKLQKR